jgi:hypothetical protein
MAYTEKNFAGVATTSAADLYAPSATGATQVVHLQAANKTGTPQTITLFLYDDSATTSYEIVSAVTIPANAMYSILNNGRIILEENDKLRIQASANSAIVVIGSAVERS